RPRSDVVSLEVEAMRSRRSSRSTDTARTGSRRPRTHTERRDRNTGSRIRSRSRTNRNTDSRNIQSTGSSTAGNRTGNTADSIRPGRPAVVALRAQSAAPRDQLFAPAEQPGDSVPRQRAESAGASRQRMPGRQCECQTSREPPGVPPAHAVPWGGEPFSVDHHRSLPRDSLLLVKHATVVPVEDSGGSEKTRAISATSRLRRRLAATKNARCCHEVRTGRATVVGTRKHVLRATRRDFFRAPAP